MQPVRKLGLKVEKLSQLSFEELYAIVGAEAVEASVVKRVCEAVSIRIELNCGAPSCGPGCTAVSHTEQTR